MDRRVVDVCWNHVAPGRVRVNVLDAGEEAYD